MQELNVRRLSTHERIQLAALYGVKIPRVTMSMSDTNAEVKIPDGWVAITGGDEATYEHPQADLILLMTLDTSGVPIYVQRDVDDINSPLMLQYAPESFKKLSLLREIKVLDHGHCRLVDFMGSDLSIVRNARVSYDAEWRAGEDSGSDAKLINYLATNGHNTPFEAATITFDIKAPIFVFRQWHRHRTQCLSGDTRIKFARPVDGKAYLKTIGELAELWFAPEYEVKRPDKQTRTLREWNRDRIRNMKLWCIENGETPVLTRITDVMVSGEKEVFVMTSENGDKIKASKDHKFLTTDGWKALGEIIIGDKILTIAKTANVEKAKEVSFSEEEIATEEWRVTKYPNVSVSNLGRVTRRNILLTPTITYDNRAVVSIKDIDGKWRAKQVSKLVANGFLTGSGHVLHLDDCSVNNRVTNLVYGDDQLNHDHALKNGRRAFNNVTRMTVTSIEPAGVEMTYDIEVEHSDHNFIAENFCTHNSYNELSARYKELPAEFYIPEAHLIGKQNKDNKQMRDPMTVEEFNALPEDEQQYIHGLRDIMRTTNTHAFNAYKGMIASGTPRELARSVLPVATYSHMFATVNLHNLFRFMSERLHPHAQYEIRVYAKAMLELIEPIYPVAVASFRKNLGFEL